MKRFLASVAVVALAVSPAVAAPPYKSGHSYHAGFLAGGQTRGFNIGEETVALYAFYVENAVNITDLCARADHPEPGESFRLFIYANNPATNLPAAAPPVARTAPIGIGSIIPSGDVRCGDIVNVTYYSLPANTILWAGVSTSSDTQSFQAQVTTNAGAGLAGSADPRRLLAGDGSMGFNVIACCKPYTSINLNLTTYTIVQQARNAAMLFTVH